MEYPVEVYLYEELPKLKVISTRGPGMWKIDGEDFDETFVSTRSVSTYPHLPNGEKDGEPIADRLYVEMHENRAMVAVADGCNWGKRPQMAARDAVSAVSNYLSEKQGMIKDLQDAGHYLLRSFSEAHKRIVAGKEDIWEAGTTTLLGALCLELESPEPGGGTMWGVLCASVGDCKAFIATRKKREVIDVTMGNRDNVADGKDPGGRLGPYIGQGWPDLRNLRLYFCPCEVDDIILIMSDGVHDNLDPQTLGKLPADLNLTQQTWEEFSHPALKKIKSEYMKALLADLVFTQGGGDMSPIAITKRVISHCLEVTRKSREFMEEFPKNKQPVDYVEFPGKMDHTTCVTFLVGHKNSSSSSSSSSSSANHHTTSNTNFNNANNANNTNSNSPQLSSSSSSSSSRSDYPIHSVMNSSFRSSFGSMAGSVSTNAGSSFMGTHAVS